MKSSGRSHKEVRGKPSGYGSHVRCQVYCYQILLMNNKNKQRSTRLDRKQENGEIFGSQRMTRMCMPRTNQDDHKFLKSPPSRFSFEETIRHSISFIRHFISFILNPKESLLSCRSYLEGVHVLARSDVLGKKIIYCERSELLIWQVYQFGLGCIKHFARTFNMPTSYQ